MKSSRLFFIFYQLLFGISIVSAQESEAIRRNQVGCSPQQEKVIVVEGINPSGKVRVTAPDGKTLKPKATIRKATSPWSDKTRYVVDLGELTATGSYHVSVGNQTCDINVSDRPYRDIAKASLRLFYLIRSGVPIEQGGDYNRPLGHPDTQVIVHNSAASSLRPAGTVISSPYGWYDAGDYNKYVVNSAFSIGLMFAAYEANTSYFTTMRTDIPESGNSTPDLLDEMMFNLRWLLTMQDPSDGGVYHKLTTPKFEDFKMPADCHQPRYVVAKSVTATLDFAAVMADASRLFEPFQHDYPGFSAIAAAAAERAYLWAKEHPTDFYRQDQLHDPAVTTGTYADRNARDEFFWAASALYRLTGKQHYLDDARQHQPQRFTTPSWPNVASLGAFEWLATETSPLRATMLDQLTAYCDEAIKGVDTSCFQSPYGNSPRDFGWGCLAERCCCQGVALLYADKLLATDKYRRYALQNADYLLGRNATGYCYVTGFGDKSPMHPHHRPSASDGIERPFPGMLVGGPNPGQQDKAELPLPYPSDFPDESYLDITKSYASNEIAINWNASLVAFLGWLDALSSRTQQRREQTTFQTAAHWKPATDIRADVVMVYGANDRQDETFRQRVQSWRDRGYTTHYMTGIAWGEYQDYFTGRWDGQWHLDEGQKQANGDTIWHGRLIPYIVPTRNYLNYFKQRHIRPVIDAGISAIFLEEPEFWARSGYSEAFKREWQEYYGFPWRPQHESAENTYLSNKLKYHLYYRALDETFTYAKQYGREKGMDVSCYVPTHSLLNYAQWGIVSPEASLASMTNCDGYIAQVWTGTARVPNYFNGVLRERTFETAFLEYGCMYSMVAPTHRKVFFLTDPIEDQARDWQDFKRNYQATFVAQLLYPSNNAYEVMPWPDRIYERPYLKSRDSDERVRIPRFYSTQMQVMINALNDMPVCQNQVSGTQGVSVLMSNSLMFQRSPQPVEGYDDPQLANFLGLALPFLERGVPVNIVHLENTGYPDTWRDTRVLLMSYANQKPMSAAENEHIAQWVHDGGHIIYAGRDNDPFQRIQEWWNQGNNHYQAPADHLFTLMGIAAAAPAGTYTYGKGTVQIIRQDPKEFVMQAQGDARLLEAVRTALHKLDFKNSFRLTRGTYELAAVLDEDAADSKSLTLKGCFIDLFDPQLPVVEQKTIAPGEQAFLYNIDKVSEPRHPQVLAAASRQYDERIQPHTYAFTAKSPAETTNAMRILLPDKPKRIHVSTASDSRWDKRSRTLWLTFENNPDGVKVEIEF